VIHRDTDSKVSSHATFLFVFLTRKSDNGLVNSFLRKKHTQTTIKRLSELLPKDEGHFSSPPFKFSEVISHCIQMLSDVMFCMRSRSYQELNM
jgi:hypothetical protein